MKKKYVWIATAADGTVTAHRSLESLLDHFEGCGLYVATLSGGILVTTAKDSAATARAVRVPLLRWNPDEET